MSPAIVEAVRERVQRAGSLPAAVNSWPTATTTAAAINTNDSLRSCCLAAFVETLQHSGLILPARPANVT
ncbi:MAG: hypothetical protein DWH78_08170 [Planctomycetota bacterium]|nr:MAG: hypothetical protein DWH78_08170 [Planctomycetota bacterium]